MGVPGFFRWLNDKDEKKELIKKTMEIEIDNLYLDLNCALHPQCFKILDENPEFKSYQELEEKMIIQSIKYLDEIINYVKPKKMIYIGIDGVAPMGKIKQQRYRRYKSVNDKRLFDNIKKKYNKPINRYWNNSAITPGTLFLNKIKEAIIKYCKERKEKIIFSSGNTPGEGEHKIIQKIKKIENENHVIYGLDADLLFLALATEKENIYLLREANQFKKHQEGFNYVSINRLKKIIVEIFNNEIEDYELEEKRVVLDFILICFFLGNDFIPHLPSTDIYHHGMDIIIKEYLEILKETNKYIYKENKKINSTFIIKLIEKIEEKEKENLKLIRKDNLEKKIPNYLHGYEREMYKIENLLFKIDDPILLGEEGYRERYYIHYGLMDKIDNMCEEYIKSISWISQYYIKECPSWEYYYPYDIAPLAEDLREYVKKRDIKLLINYHFEKGNSLRPYEQLALVLPTSSFNLLPKKITDELRKEKDIYIEKYDLDLLNKSKYFKVIPILPDFRVEKVKEIINKIELSGYEKTLNSFEKEYKFN